MNWKYRLRRLLRTKRVVVLMYHRVDDVPLDPWRLAVSPLHFEMHLKVLKNNYQVISPKELVDQLENNSLKRNQVCITFDDGYLDNYTQAMPLLEKYLALPNVHLGIDPEYSMKGGEIPGDVIGTMDAADVNYASEFLSGIAEKNNLPPKLLIDLYCLC